MTVVVRFAPSPTGYLHIGGARTALFNWLFARHHNGKFLLRIEDTDRERSTPQAVDAIFESLQWLGLTADEPPVFQFARANRHGQVAHQLVAEGKAYKCYCSPAELETMREEARTKGLPPRYNGHWRHRNEAEAPAGVKPVIRFKAPQTGETVIHDLVQGEVKLNNTQLDDMVLLRADGTPTYMLSVVVDDHDMNITHIIRGDDHLTNAFRQYHLYQACGWTVPAFAHIPLIHGPDGAKLSKRHGALSAHEYKAMGILPEAMCNYLLRLGWSHGDDEIISTQQAIDWFNVQSIGRSPARLDMAKLLHLNAHYLKQADPARLYALIVPLLASHGIAETDTLKQRIIKGMPGLAERAKTLPELADNAVIYGAVQPRDDKAKLFHTPETQKLIKDFTALVAAANDFTHGALMADTKAYCAQAGLKLGNLAGAIRVALTGRTISPSIFEVMEVLGRDETLARLHSFG
jgi:glutamyl-tRNA synthetase